eukprot:CAMPEP_0169203096 /NCGR_PEP_ID=MMETSP1016-20121227/11282_1 /TAXON_ID=342587 /ORGANISM="Karlodinium micrum, Strain CCMP2283" /LENGTH=51 /DNA_ID=CAMNT_0009280113 /DNA_START=117 /DNA_END=272 /DNA_ORIENTATION=-
MQDGQVLSEIRTHSNNTSAEKTRRSTTSMRKDNQLSRGEAMDEDFLEIQGV